MDTISKFEKLLAAWYEHAPHLSVRSQRWLAENVWWMALVGIVLLVCGMFVVIPYLFAALAVTTTTSIATPYIPFYQHSLGLTWLALLLNMLSYVAVALMLSFAVGRLRAKEKHGWDIAFWSLLINFTLNITGAAVLYSWLGVSGAILGAILGGYFLFEIREQFARVETRKTSKHKKLVVKV